VVAIGSCPAPADGAAAGLAGASGRRPSEPDGSGSRPGLVVGSRRRLLFRGSKFCGSAGTRQGVDGGRSDQRDASDVS
jgi:hypothetical protein